MPDNIRMKRISAFFQQELSRIVSRELKDPVFENKVISFSGIKVTRDLSIAHVMVSVLGGSNETTAIVAALNRAEPIVRREIISVSKLRRIPHFEFHEDHTMEMASKIDTILNMLDIPPEEPAEPEE